MRSWTVLIGMTWGLAVAIAAPATGGAIATVTVGSGLDCDYSDLQVAVDDARSNGFPLTQIEVSLDYTDVHLDIHDQSIVIDGGFLSCNGPPVVTTALLSGAGNPADSVINIHGGGIESASVVLRNLRVEDGDPLAGNLGGGIQILGNNAVTLENVKLRGNMSDRGGGVYIDGGAGATLWADQKTQILTNVANQTGGGIHCVNLIAVQAALRFEGDIAGNRAVLGGGIYADNCPVSITTFKPLDGIRQNRATGSGGGLYATNGSFVTIHGVGTIADLVENRADLDGGGALITGNAQMFTTNTRIASNVAIDSGGGVHLASGQLDLDANGPCGEDRCSRVENNTAGSQGGALFQQTGDIAAGNTWFLGNSAPDGSLIKSEGGSTEFDSIIAARHADATAVFRLKNGTHVIRFSTLADNQDMINTIMMTGGSLDLSGSIIWESTGISVGFFGAATTTTLSCLILHNYPAILMATDVAFVDPEFADPANGNYRLSTRSSAIDFCDDRILTTRRKAPPMAFDIDRDLRGVDFIASANFLGTFDLGADEVVDPVFSDGFEDPL